MNAHKAIMVKCFQCFALSAVTLHFCLFYQTEVNSMVVVESMHTNLGNYYLFFPHLLFLLF